MHAIILKGAITIHHNYSSAATSESSLFCQNSRMFRFIWETGWTRFSSWVQVHIQYQPHGANINCRIGPRLNHIELCAPVSSQPASQVVDPYVLRLVGNWWSRTLRCEKPCLSCALPSYWNSLPLTIIRIHWTIQAAHETNLDVS